MVPSPTSSSWTLEMLTKIFAAALSNWIAFNIVAPSLVTLISPEEADCKILFIPFGPSVDLTRSPRARAPTKEERRAFSAFSSVAYARDTPVNSEFHSRCQDDPPPHQRCSSTLQTTRIPNEQTDLSRSFHIGSWSPSVIFPHSLTLFPTQNPFV